MSANITTAQTTTLNVDASNENWVVDIGGSITVANGHGITNNFVYHDSVIAVSGSVVADGLYKSAILSSGEDAQLQVDTMGSIHGHNGMAIYGEGTYAENLGQITAANIGIYANANDIDIVNKGTIEAKIGVYVDNAYSSMSSLKNSGTIHGDNGIVFVGGGPRIDNTASGVIDAKFTAITFGENVNDTNSVSNDGVISSDDIAILGSSSRDYVFNSGTINGKIQLGGGNDSFANLGGTIDHAVDGGLGDDSYDFGSGSAFAIIDAGGTDAIASQTSRSLASYDMIEDLYLYGKGNDKGTGNALANDIYGSKGNNILDGGLDAVEDELSGGAGNDTYVLRDGHDQVSESAFIKGDVLGNTGGIDTITSTISRNLADYDEVENLQLLGSGNIDGTGSVAVNTITGNSGNNVLDGGIEDGSEGEAIDTLKGGAGNDTYVLGTGHDIVVDTAGIDTITTEISRSLADYPTIENLVLLGTGNISGTGNALANIITGNGGNNILDGGIDTLVDTLKGGAGNDFYILGAGNDTVVDTAGTDTITSLTGRSLADYAAIENLTLKGTDNVNATGNALANTLSGNAGNNILDGGADNVVDTLKGDLGNDTYVLGSGFDIVSDGGGVDLITSTITRSLANTSAIENLKLLGSTAIDGTGNALGNLITGNSAINALSGLSGDDILIGGGGADKLDGGTDSDTASYAGASAGVTASLLTASTNTGDAKGDTYVSIENLTGSGHNDTLTGNTGANVLSGGTGADSLTGGTGADVFLFKFAGESTMAAAGQDTIFDFSHSQGDKVNLSGIDADTVLGGDQAFVFKGTAAFSGAKGELHQETIAGDTYVYGDVNGDKVADFAIHFDTAVVLQANDFIF